MNPRHGGQIRLSEICNAYRRDGFDVLSINCFPASAFYLRGPKGEFDFPIPPHQLSEYRGLRAPFIEDLACGERVVAHSSIMRRIRGVVKNNIDVIHLEQPWLLPLAQEIESWCHSKPLFVYGSQNVEMPLKRDIFLQYKVDAIGPVLECINALERQAVLSSDLVLSVTEQDAAVLRQWVRSDARVALAGNGVRPWAATPDQLRRWRTRLGGRPFALYAASGHPPNIKGFCESFGQSLAGLAPDQQIVLVGGVADQLSDHPWFNRWASLNARRVVRLGVVNQTDLDAVRSLAHVFILPTTSGGGSHLKTAEALFSGSAVVATPLAMRGFEDFSELPGVQIVEPGSAFGKAVSQSLSIDKPKQTTEAIAKRHSLTWAHSLASMTALVREIRGLR